MLDCFAGSGTTGRAAHALGRKFILIDNNPEALAVMQRRFQRVPVEFHAEPQSNGVSGP